MKNLQEATERICELKGSVLALDALVMALIAELPEARRGALLTAVQAHVEVARTVLLNSSVSEHTLSAFERDIARVPGLIAGPAR